MDKEHILDLQHDQIIKNCHGPACKLGGRALRPDLSDQSSFHAMYLSKIFVFLLLPALIHRE